MLQISKEEYEKFKIEVIDKGRYFWVNRKKLEVKSDVANWAQIFDKCDPRKQKYREELTPNAKYQQSRQLLLLLAFQKQPLEVFYEKRSS